MHFLPFNHVPYRLTGAIAGLSGIGMLFRIQRQPFTTLHAFIVIDGLSCLVLITAGLLMFTIPAHWRRVGQLAALGFAILSGHLAGIAVGLMITLLLSERWRERGAGVALATGYGLIGWFASSWRLNASGDGLNSLSFILLLAGAAIAAGLLDLATAKRGPFDPLAALAGIAAVLRLFSVGPWNLGWQLATLLLGGMLAISAAWRAATTTEPLEAEEWLQRSLSGLALTVTGCASPAGVAAAGLLLLHLTLRRLAQPMAGSATWAGWLLTGAVPGTLGFVAFWSASAAAMAAGIPVLAIVVWAAALLCMLAAGRHIQGPARWPSTAGALAGLALGLAAPVLARWLLRPLSDHLQGGLTPYGAIEPWGWAGLLALDSGARTAATAPGLALLALMGLFGALVWLISRWRGWV
ncbi:hypothetical protein A6A03_11500 [Chloroflexus islandicus]|uniref:Uncharacterized protein n=1 Tax=Chloroflexus islandicus TaxID=1707952 RepID=A0A178MFS8_9CHLR|nr:hypothetical protein [Chloroflexus islandicus]OAN46925.1 hypothetical protein A6A03_11500 [Chloroflexus islandicus]